MDPAEEIRERIRELWDRFEERKVTTIPRRWPRGMWVRRLLEDKP